MTSSGRGVAAPRHPGRSGRRPRPDARSVRAGGTTRAGRQARSTGSGRHRARRRRPPPGWDCRHPSPPGPGSCHSTGPRRRALTRRPRAGPAPSEATAANASSDGSSAGGRNGNDACDSSPDWMIRCSSVSIAGSVSIGR